MTDRPIIFSGPMVLAMLDGRKTQTRRLLNPQPETFLVDGRECDVVAMHVDGEAVPRVATGRVLTRQKLRYAVGDRLYVREAWSVRGRYSDITEVGYAASRTRSHTEYVEQFPNAHAVPGKGKWPAWPKYGPSIHMPRWASRLTLIVDDVRVERLQAISEADAIAEGIALQHAASCPVIGYQTLWNLLHKESGERWDDNPFVVAVSFRVVHGNIDQVPA